MLNFKPSPLSPHAGTTFDTLQFSFVWYRLKLHTSPLQTIKQLVVRFIPPKRTAAAQFTPISLKVPLYPTARTASSISSTSFPQHRQAVLITQYQHQDILRSRSKQNNQERQLIYHAHTSNTSNKPLNQKCQPGTAANASLTSSKPYAPLSPSPLPIAIHAD
jgi:hypothetical protein